VTGQHKVGQERRQHVRVRPTADYEIRAEVLAGEITDSMLVVDLSMGGIKLILSPTIEAVPVGDELRLRLKGPRDPMCELRAQLRYRSVMLGTCGLQFVDLDEAALRMLRHAVGDLLERGSLA
jgi:c-di-GMP-binding flagellar brake protein YcgR